VGLATLIRADVVGIGFLLELGFLGGRAQLRGQNIHAVMRY
jgi:hypothetical protein